MEHLIIDPEKCIGCGKCVRMCMKENLKVEDKVVRETGRGCIQCGHCVSTCPKGAIKLMKKENPKTDPFSMIKNSRMFDGTLISDEDIDKLCTSMKKDLGNNVRIAVIQGEDLDLFMEDVFEILEKEESEHPLVKEWGEWRKNYDSLQPNPALWEGGQVLLIFADSNAHALEASNRMMVKGIELGIRGFHSSLIMMASKIDRAKILSHFPEVSDELRMAYVIGHGRRLIEPVFKPFGKIKSIFDKL